MKHLVYAFFCILLVSAAAPGASTRVSDDPGLLVTTDWLAKHLADDNMVLLHAHWTSGSYKKAHIPGARFLWLSALSKDTPERNTELPPTDDARKVIQELGITDKSRIVVYFEGGNMTMATRMILTFSYLGLGDRIALLDGGFEAWKNEGRPVSSEVPNVISGSFVPKPHPELIRDAEWVRQHAADPGVTIIDARARRFYDGAAGNPPGHIPHAVSIPFSSVADTTNRMLHPDSLRAAFERAGAKPGNRLVTYCHVGQQATLVYFAARLLGYDVSVYDGSFEDWADRNLPVEGPAKKE